MPDSKNRLYSHILIQQQTHWPHANIFTERKYTIERLGQPETYVRDRPFHEPEETEQVLKLAGVLPY